MRRSLESAEKEMPEREMDDLPTIDIYLSKAEASLAGAASEHAHGRFGNCANRAYCACFQAAVGALMPERIRRPGRTGQWGHDFVQAQFVGELINRRKRYSPNLRETLVRGVQLRQTADYTTDRVSEVQASRALARAREFVVAVIDAGDERR